MQKNKIISLNLLLMYLHFDDTNASRTRSSDKVEPTKDVFEIWTRYLQDGYIPCSCMTIDQWLVALKGCRQFGVYISSKPRTYGIKI